MLDAFLAAMALIGRELCTRTCNDHHPMARLARHRPITGHPVAGWVTTTT